jgi:hypothetical protein
MKLGILFPVVLAGISRAFASPLGKLSTLRYQDGPLTRRESDQSYPPITIDMPVRLKSLTSSVRSNSHVD